MTSVLQSWVEDLPIREQGTILTAIRGCDAAPKNPLDAPERRLVGFLRFCTLNPADSREIGIPGAFFQPAPRDFRASELGHYSVHWYSHLMHAFEVVAYRHPIAETALIALGVYTELVRGLHLTPESRGEMIIRLSEDRILSGTVVS